MSLFIYYCLNAFYWPSTQRLEISGTSGSKRHSPSKALMVLLDILVLCSEITSINQLQSLCRETSHFPLKLLNSCRDILRAPQEQGQFLKINNNKQPAKDALNNGFTQKPKTMSSKALHHLRETSGKVVFVSSRVRGEIMLSVPTM